jgi:hypothetical protein
MANGEWLTQLLSGLGGAFTGEVAARGRIAEEQEMQRKREEAERLKEQERQMSELRRGLLESFSPENARAAAAKGLPTSEVSAIMRMNEPTKTEPKITERRESGGIALYEGDNFKGWKIRPPSEREGPSPMQLQTEAKRDVRSAQSELRGAESGFQRILSSRPKQSQYLQPISGLPDTAAFRGAEESWRPESAYFAQRRTGAQQDVSEAQAALRQAMGMPAPTTAPQTGMVANAATQQQVAMEMQDAIRRIQASALSPEEKRMRIEQVNQRATALLGAGGR